MAGCSGTRFPEFFDEELATQFTEYDVDAANEHLDHAGLTERDPAGVRLDREGNPVSIYIEVPIDAFAPFWVAAAELIVEYWRAVGIDAEVKTEDRSLYTERVSANKHDAAVWNGDSADLNDEMLDPRYYFPRHTGGSRYAIPWATWYTSYGKEGEEPPEPAKRQIELYRQLIETPEEEGRNELFREVLAIAKEEFYLIGTIWVPEGYGSAQRPRQCAKGDPRVRGLQHAGTHQSGAVLCQAISPWGTHGRAAECLVLDGRPDAGAGTAARSPVPHTQPGPLGGPRRSAGPRTPPTRFAHRRGRV